MLGRSLWIGLSAAVLLGCSADAETLFVRFPEAEMATSAILAMTDGESLALSAHRLGEHPRLGPEANLDIKAHTRLELMLFDQSLEELGLEAGPIPIDAAGLAVPTPRVTYALDIDGDTPGAWMSAQLSPLVLTTRIRRDPSSLCATFAVEAQYETGAGMDIAFALTLGPQAALIATLDPTLTLIDEAGARPITNYPAGLPFGAATRLADGEVWFGGEGGAVWRGRIDPPPLTAIHADYVSTSSSGQTIRWIVVRTQPELEVFTLSAEGALERYFRGEWTILHRFSGIQTKGGLVATEPGIVYAARGTPQVMRWANGALVEVTPRDLVDGITGLDYVMGTGLLISAGQGFMYVESGVGQWRQLVDESINLFIYTFSSYEEGFMIGGALGYVAQYRSANDTFCPAEQLAAGAVRNFLPFGGGLLIAEDVPISRERAIVTWLGKR